MGEKDKLSSTEQGFLPELMGDQLADIRSHEMGSDAWWSLLEDSPEINKVPVGYHGFVEGIFVSPEDNGVIFGWALHPDDAMICLEDEAQNVYPLIYCARGLMPDHGLRHWRHRKPAAPNRGGFAADAA